MIRSSDSLAPLSPRAKDLVVRFHDGSSWREKLFGRTAHDLAIQRHTREGIEQSVAYWSPK